MTVKDIVTCIVIIQSTAACINLSLKFTIRWCYLYIAPVHPVAVVNVHEIYYNPYVPHHITDWGDLIIMCHRDRGVTSSHLSSIECQGVFTRWVIPRHYSRDPPILFKTLTPVEKPHCLGVSLPQLYVHVHVYFTYI